MLSCLTAFVRFYNLREVYFMKTFFLTRILEHKEIFSPRNKKPSALNCFKNFPRKTHKFEEKEIIERFRLSSLHNPIS